MNRDKHPQALVKIRTILVIILSALVTSMIIELIISERTNALIQETLQGTTSLVKQVVAPVLPVPAQVMPAPAQTISPNQKSSATSSPSAVVPVTASNQAISANDVVPLMASDLQKISFSKVTPRQSFNSVQQAGASNRAISYSSFAWLQATEQGWKIAGIVGYWWTIGIITLTFGVIIWRRSLRQYVIDTWLSRQYTLFAE
jgi:hypothetical protein